MTGFAMPAGACDTHVHFYAPGETTAPGAAGGFAMPPADLPTYRAVMDRLGLDRVVAVQSVAYGTDNGVMMAAATMLGPACRMVVVLPADAPKGRMQQLDLQGARGLRAYMQTGATYQWDELPNLARRIAPLGWHLQLQFDGCLLPDRAEMIAGLPCDLVIDHIGKFLSPVSVSSPAYLALIRLIDARRTWVKLSAPYESSRTGPPDYADTSALARDLVIRAPERMLWATNFPHPGRKDPPEERVLLDLLMDWAPNPADRIRILRDNPAVLYRF